MARATVLASEIQAGDVYGTRQLGWVATENAYPDEEQRQVVISIRHLPSGKIGVRVYDDDTKLAITRGVAVEKVHTS